MNGNPDVSGLSPVFKRHKNIQAVYLFGSTASGHTHAQSDLDLAVVAHDPQPTRLELLADLATAGFCNVDVIFLNTDDIVLKFEAVRHNALVYRRDDFDAGSYFSLIVRQYWDFLPYLEEQRAAYRKRILDGQTGSAPKATGKTGRIPTDTGRVPDVDV